MMSSARGKPSGIPVASSVKYARRECLEKQLHQPKHQGDCGNRNETSRIESKGPTSRIRLAGGGGMTPTESRSQISLSISTSRLTVANKPSTSSGISRPCPVSRIPVGAGMGRAVRPNPTHPINDGSYIGLPLKDPARDCLQYTDISVILKQSYPRNISAGVSNQSSCPRQGYVPNPRLARETINNTVYNPRSAEQDPCEVGYGRIPSMASSERVIEELMAEMSFDECVVSYDEIIPTLNNYAQIRNQSRNSPTSFGTSPYQRSTPRAPLAPVQPIPSLALRTLNNENCWVDPKNGNLWMLAPSQWRTQRAPLAPLPSAPPIRPTPNRIMDSTIHASFDDTCGAYVSYPRSPQFKSLIRGVAPAPDTSYSMSASPMSPQMAARPISSQMAARPISPQMGARPMSSQMASRPMSPQMASRPMSPQMAARPMSPQMAARSMSPQMAARSMSPQMAARPMSPQMAASSQRSQQLTSGPCSPQMNSSPRSAPRAVIKITVSPPSTNGPVQHSSRLQQTAGSCVECPFASDVSNIDGPSFSPQGRPVPSPFPTVASQHHVKNSLTHRPGASFAQFIQEMSPHMSMEQSLLAAANRTNPPAAGPSDTSARTLHSRSSRCPSVTPAARDQQAGTADRSGNINRQERSRVTTQESQQSICEPEDEASSSRSDPNMCQHMVLHSDKSALSISRLVTQDPEGTVQRFQKYVLQDAVNAETKRTRSLTKISDVPMSPEAIERYRDIRRRDGLDPGKYRSDIKTQKLYQETPARNATRTQLTANVVNNEDRGVTRTAYQETVDLQCQDRAQTQTPLPLGYTYTNIRENELAIGGNAPSPHHPEMIIFPNAMRSAQGPHMPQQMRSAQGPHIPQQRSSSRSRTPAQSQGAQVECIPKTAVSSADRPTVPPPIVPSKMSILKKSTMSTISTAAYPGVAAMERIIRTVDEIELDMPELIAARIHYEREVSLHSNPPDIVSRMMSERGGVPTINVGPAAPGPFKGLVIPLGASTSVPRDRQSHDLEIAALAVKGLPLQQPKDNIVSTTYPDRVPPRQFSRWDEREDHDGTTSPPASEGDGPDLSELINIVEGDVRIRPSSAQTAAPDNENSPNNAFLCNLQIKKPRNLTRVQLRGSSLPKWFNGFFTQLPNQKNINRYPSILGVLGDAHSSMGPRPCDIIINTSIAD